MFEDGEGCVPGSKRKYDTAVPAFPVRCLPVDGAERNPSGYNGCGEDTAAEPKRVRLSTLSGDEISSDEISESEAELDSEHDLEPYETTLGGIPSPRQGCACCHLATSELMISLDSVADRLAGRACDSRVTAIQLEIFESRVAPLRAEGREVPNINRRVLSKHYTQHRISPLRSVAEDIRIFELAERTLRRTGLAEEDEEGVKMLNSRGAAELCKLSKSKLDALKFYVSLDKMRKEEEANIKN